jgi:hypothetical protein
LNARFAATDGDEIEQSSAVISRLRGYPAQLVLNALCIE